MNWPDVDVMLNAGIPCTEVDAWLAMGPWAWPPEGTPAFASACARTERHGPPPPVIGTAWVVTVDDARDRVTLWRVHAEPASGGGVAQPSLCETTREAVSLAMSLAVKMAPVLWSATSVATLPAPRFQRVITVCSSTWRRPMNATGPARIEGRSLAAAVTLATVSSLLKVPVDPTVVVSADLDTSGTLLPVGGIAMKARVVQHLLAPARLWTAEGGESAGLEASVPPVAAAADLEALLAAAFPSVRDLVKRHLDDLTPPVALVKMENEVLGHRRSGLVWAPLQRLADEADRQLVTNAQEQAALFRLLGRVASRHQGGRETLSPVPWDVIRALPTERRGRYHAHLCQHAADTGDPPLRELEVIERDLEDDREGRTQIARRVAGALSRARAVTGPLERELRVQRQLAHDTALAGQTSDISFPLSMWLRLAGAARAPRCFTEAIDFRRQWASIVETEDSDASRFLDQAQTFAAALLGFDKDVPAPGVPPAVEKMQLVANTRRLRLLVALGCPTDTRPDQVFGELLVWAAEVLGRESVGEADRRVALRYLLLSCVDCIADHHKALLQEAVLVDLVRRIGDDTVLPATTSAAFLEASAVFDGAARPDGDLLQSVLNLFLAVEPEPMRRVSAAEAAAGHPDAAALADAIRRRYPY